MDLFALGKKGCAFIALADLGCQHIYVSLPNLFWARKFLPRRGGILVSMESIKTGLSYGDVLLIPRKTSINSRRDVSTDTIVAKNLKLKVPIISANMDTVTESTMAISMARQGGLGIIHRFMTIERQAREIERVKRAEAYIIERPYTIGKDATLGEAKEDMIRLGVSGLLVADRNGKLEGLISRRDIRFKTNDDEKILSIMTKKADLVMGKEGMGINEAIKLLDKNKLEKLPLVDDTGAIKGLITAKDLERFTNTASAKDARGRLLVGGAIGTKGDFIERALALAGAGVDILVLDVAHGHSDSVIKAIKKVKSEVSDVPLMAGNVATKEATDDLIDAGADCIKVGIGPGAACTTRLVTGSGMPQLTAVMDCAKVAQKRDIPIVADGGIKNSGDVTKALSAGANAVMIGSLLAGTDESPGYFLVRDGIKYKAYRGMASIGANISRKQIDKIDIDPNEILEIVPEGVESSVPYRGSVNEVLAQLMGGVHSGMSYCGAGNLNELRKNARFIMLTTNGASESYQKLSR